MIPESLISLVAVVRDIDLLHTQRGLADLGLLKPLYLITSLEMEDKGLSTCEGP